MPTQPCRAAQMRTGLARTERVQEEVYEGKTDWVKKVIAKGTAHGTVSQGQGEAMPGLL